MVVSKQHLLPGSLSSACGRDRLFVDTYRLWVPDIIVLHVSSHLKPVSGF